MNDLPDGWEWTTLGDIAKVVGGVTKDSKKQADPSLSEVPYLRVANVQRGYLDLQEVTTIRVPEATLQKLRLLPGDILFNEGGDRDKLGRGWVWEGQVPDCIHQNHVFRARIRPDEYDPKFISMYGNSLGRKWFEDHGKQTVNLASISLSTLKGLPVPQIPLYEQQKIVAAIEEQFSRLDAGVAALRRAAQTIKRMRDALFQLTIPQKSENWELVTIDDSIRVVDYRGRTPPFSAVGIPHLRSFNVKDGRVNWDGCAWVTEETYDKYMSRGLPSSDDLLFTTEAPMGEVAPAPDKKFCMAQRMMLLKPDLATWLPEYLMYHFRSPWFQARLRLNATGTTVQGISSRNFRPLRLYAPPLAIQEMLASQIRENLSVIQDLERELQVASARSRQLRIAILASAFSGKLVLEEITA